MVEYVVSVYSTYLGYITLGRNWANIFNWCKELQIIFSPKGSECNFAIREFGKVQGRAWSNNHLKSFYSLSDNKDNIHWWYYIIAICWFLYINGPRRSRRKNLNMSVKWIEKRLFEIMKSTIMLTLVLCRVLWYIPAHLLYILKKSWVKTTVSY